MELALKNIAAFGPMADKLAERLKDEACEKCWQDFMPPFLHTCGRCKLPTRKEGLFEKMTDLSAELQQSTFLAGLIDSAVADNLEQMEGLTMENVKKDFIKARVSKIQSLLGQQKHARRPRVPDNKVAAASYLQEHLGTDTEELMKCTKLELVNHIDEHWLSQCKLARDISLELQSISCDETGWSHVEDELLHHEGAGATSSTPAPSVQ